MTLQAWFYETVKERVQHKGAKDEETFGIILRLLENIEHCQRLIKESREKEHAGLVWRYKYNLERLPFILARKYGYKPQLTCQTQEELMALERTFLNCLGRIWSDSSRATLTDISAVRMEFHSTSFIQRHWLNLSMALTAALLGRKMITQLDPVIVWEYCMDTIAASRNLLHKWIYLPLLEIWNTVRYSKSSIRITDDLALQQDFDALNRMVQEFKNDSSSGPTSLDFSLILQEYEKNLKHPIRSAVMGDLIRLILIQVQKSKVDLGGALLTLDKLMRANELNFELLTVIPVMTLMYFSWTKGLSLCKRLTGRSRRHLAAEFRTHLRRIDTALSWTDKDDDHITGELLHSLNQIVRIWPGLNESREEENFLKNDILQLLDTSISLSTRRWTVLRMHSYYTFK